MGKKLQKELHELNGLVEYIDRVVARKVEEHMRTQNVASSNTFVDSKENSSPPPSPNHQILRESIVTLNYNYLLRNQILVEKRRNELARSNRNLRILFYGTRTSQTSFSLLGALHAHPRIDFVALSHSEEQHQHYIERGYNTKSNKLYEWGEPNDVIDYRTFQPDVIILNTPYSAPPPYDVFHPSQVASKYFPKLHTWIGEKSAVENALFCYVPYGYTLANGWEHFQGMPEFHCHYNLPFHNFGWRYFCESEFHRQKAKEIMASGASNYVVSGHPRMDVYQEPDENNTAFPWKHTIKKKKRIVYIPHWVHTPLLEHTCEYLLQLAEKTNEYEVVLKPHPNKNKKLDRYYDRFEAGANSHLVGGGEFSSLLKTADLLILSSPSMHADSLFSGTPYVSELPAKSLNDMGKKILKCAYTSNEKEDLMQIVEEVLVNGHDKLKVARDTLRKELLPPDGQTSSELIRDHILKELGR